MCWYVDDNKIIHVNPKVVNKLIEMIEGKMPQTRGDKKNFMGINIKFKGKKVEISMKKHIQKATDTLTDDITSNAVSTTTS